jgi:hypothetical protein
MKRCVRLSTWFLGTVCSLLMIGLMGTAAQAACAQDSALYRPAFAQKDDSWTTTEAEKTTMTMHGGAVTVDDKADGSESAFYNGDTFGAVTICADIVLTSESDHNASAGLVFWSGEGANYYIFQIDPVVGTFAVQRRKDAKWLFPLDWKNSPAIVKGVNAVNELRVTTDGDQMQAFINGEKVATITGAAGAGPFNVGLHFEGGQKVHAAWSASNFTVTH